MVSIVYLMFVMFAVFNFTEVLCTKLQADKVVINGEMVKPHAIYFRKEGNMRNAFDEKNNLIYSRGNGHDYISTGDDRKGLIDLAADEEYIKLGGDAIAVDVGVGSHLHNSVDSIIHQTGNGAVCGPTDEPRYLNVYLFADANFCGLYNGAVLAEERASFFIAETNDAFAQISCMRLHLASFTMNCDATTDFYTTSLANEVGTNILWKFREIQQFSSVNGISILLQGSDDGTNTLGAAFVATACRTDYAFGWIEGKYLGPHVMAHEIGHLVSLRHAQAGIMTASLSINSQIIFSQESDDQLNLFMNDTLSNCIIPKDLEQPSSNPVLSSSSSIHPTPSTTSTPIFLPLPSPSSTASNKPIPSTIEDPSPTDDTEICGDVGEDKLNSGCSGNTILGSEKLHEQGLLEGKATAKIKQTCDSKMIFMLRSNRRKLYKLLSLSLKTSFYQDNIDEQVVTKNTGDNSKGMSVTFDINDLTIPLGSMECCGVNGPLYIKMYAAFLYKGKEDGVKRKFWKWSNNTMQVQSIYRYPVKCEDGKNNRCYKKRCDIDAKRFF